MIVARLADLLKPVRTLKSVDGQCLRTKYCTGREVVAGLALVFSIVFICFYRFYYFFTRVLQGFTRIFRSKTS